MSGPSALATVTATLQHLITNAVPGASVTTQAPSVARVAIGTSPQINIFLYATYHNTAFRNAPLPGEIRNGERGQPPLSLILKYLITTYGEQDDDISGQQLMGQAMLLLHDHPLLSRADIEGIVPDSNLHRQIERVRITPDTLSLDDMSKLWTSFQSAEYRLSTGYEVSVVLIDSTLDGNSALPVLKRGESDRGPDVVAAPAASLKGLRFPLQKPSAEFGDRVVLLGENLTADETVIYLQHPLLVDPIEIVPDPDSSATEMPLQLPRLVDDPTLVSQWPAGFYRLTLRSQVPGQPAWSSNALALALSPQIIGISPSTAAAGTVVLGIDCLPQILPEQTVALLFAGRRFIPDSITTPADPSAPSSLVFTVTDAIASATPYVLRLRIDGVDSLPVDFSGATPVYADNQKVTIT